MCPRRSWGLSALMLIRSSAEDTHPSWAWRWRLPAQRKCLSWIHMVQKQHPNKASPNEAMWSHSGAVYGDVLLNTWRSNSNYSHRWNQAKWPAAVSYNDKCHVFWCFSLWMGEWLQGNGVISSRRPRAYIRRLPWKPYSWKLLGMDECKWGSDADIRCVCCTEEIGSYQVRSECNRSTNQCMTTNRSQQKGRMGQRVKRYITDKTAIRFTESEAFCTWARH